VGNELLDFTANDGTGDRPDDATSPVKHTLRGEVLRVVFSNDDGTYVVIRLLDTDGREQTCVGPMGGLLEGQDIEVTGRWERHKEHGNQLRVQQFKAILPSTEAGIRRYLASGLIPGIGPKIAERIVDHFGVDTLDVLDNYTDRLRDVPGIGRKRIAEIRKTWAEYAQERDVQIFLQGLSLTPAYCARVIKQYGVGAPDIVRKNPYQLATDVHGIGFLIADRIAREVGIEKESTVRLAAGVLYVLDRLAEDGHTCFPRDGLLAETARILDVDIPFAEAGLERALLNGAAVAENSQNDNTQVFIYKHRLFAAETELSQALTILLNQPAGAAEAPIAHLGAGYARLNAAQREAVTQTFRSTISIITGGPGVGKTTVVGQIVEAARPLGWRIRLAAPTGRAAKRLSESTRLEAKTVHRLLKWDPKTRSFVFNRSQQLNCDLLILDEVSMLDVVLAEQLFEAIRPGTHVVLVGDRDQLPSVGPGAVLQDLIGCGRIPVTHLSEIYRQSENSRIVVNAHSVNSGEMPDLQRSPRGQLMDFYWIDQEDPERVADVICRMVSERIPRRFGFNPITQVQILSPMHRGTCGAINLNEQLQERLNPGPKPQFRVGDRKFRSGDRVMQTSNNYDKGVFNGELGQIVGIDQKEKTFEIAFDAGRIEYQWHESDQIKLAYAVTVHKSQGSEFPCVIMPVLTQHYIMLQRNLIYTGMTRAKKLLVMVGTRKALSIAIRNDRPQMRWSRLAARLQLSAQRTGTSH